MSGGVLLSLALVVRQSLLAALSQLHRQPRVGPE